MSWADSEEDGKLHPVDSEADFGPRTIQGAVYSLGSKVWIYEAVPGTCDLHVTG